MIRLLKWLHRNPGRELARIRQYLAARRLQRMVDKRANSFEIIDYRKRRQAMLKHSRGMA